MPASRRNILVFRFSALGDVTMAVPVIKAVLEQNPEVEITLVTPKWLHPLFPFEGLNLVEFDKNGEHKGFGGLMKLFKILKKNKVDAVADIHGVLRTFVLDNQFKLAGKKVVKIDKGRKEKRKLISNGAQNSKPTKHTTERYAEVFRKLGLKVNLTWELKNHISGEINSEKSNVIGIAPFAKHEGKMFPLEKMKKVAEILSEKGKSVKIFGAKSEFEQIKDWVKFENVQFSKTENLKDELEEIQNLDAMISMDSANMHLASLVGVAVVSVWGVTHPSAGFLGFGQALENVVQDENLSWRPSSVFGKKLGPKKSTGFENISENDILKKLDKFL